MHTPCTCWRRSTLDACRGSNWDPAQDAEERLQQCRAKEETSALGKGK